MVTAILKPTVQDLQKDVIELLEQISALMNSVSTALSSDSRENKYRQFEKEVIEAAINVKELKLMMAIVAPMKAGKSTIINAIIGQEILPSRNAAMTTLPTEIIFDARLEKPILTLSAEILTVFQETVSALQKKMQMLGIEQMQEKIAQYPHLNQLLQEIQNTVGFPIRSKTTGREEIIKALTGLNDIIRLCSLLEPTKDPLGQLEDFPCIYTPFWRSQTTTRSEKLGNLVIVDTPGPNEAVKNLGLAAVVKKQLEASSIVLLVLDFTQLNTEAAEKVKEDVEKVIEVRGKDNLYILINKIDERKSASDMTSEQVRQFVAAQLGLGDGDTNRVFEVSARKAFSAASFMHELEQYPEAEVSQMQTARSLAQEIFVTRREDKFKRATVDDLYEEAQTLWEDSGFMLFIDEAINRLIEEAASKCVKSALNIGHSNLRKLIKEVNLQYSALSECEDKLQQEIVELDTDLALLDYCQSELPEVDKIKRELQDKLFAIVNEIKSHASQDKLSIEEIQNASCWNKWIDNNIKSHINYRSSYCPGSIEFKSVVDAQKFTEQVFVWANQKIEVLFSHKCEEIKENIEQEYTKLNDCLNKKTEPIIEKAYTRLKETFNVDLSLPQLNFKSDVLLMLYKPSVEHYFYYTEQGYGERIINNKLFGLIPFKVKESFKNPHLRHDYYIVNLQEILLQIDKSITKQISNIEIKISKTIKEVFQERADNSLIKTKSYFVNYRNALEQARLKQYLSVEKQNNLKGELSFLVQEAVKKIDKLDIYIERIDKMSLINN